MYYFRRGARRYLSNVRSNVRYCYRLAHAVTQPVERKYLLEWIGSHRPGFLLDRALPWICYPAWDYLLKTLPQNITVFEYGSGGSTLAWLRHFNANCTSIEHDRNWYEVISRKLHEAGLLPRIDYRFVPAIEQLKQHGEDIDFFDPTVYLDEKLKGNFENYVRQIDPFPDEHFDMVVVDGRSRPACIQHAMPKVKLGGLLLVDNSERQYFRHLQSLYDMYDEMRFTGIIPTQVERSQTSIFIRRASS